MVHLGNFDASLIEPLAPFEPLPPGRYLAMITASDLKPNKAGTGNFLELVFTIIEGEYKGRQLWVRLNVDHPNPLAVKMAQAELAAICRAVGVLQPRDSVELHNLPLVIKVAYQQRPETGELVNVIKGYEKRETLPVAPPPAPPTTPPWRRP